MQFRDFIIPGGILADLVSRNKSDIITELAEALFAGNAVGADYREGVLAGLFHREELQSTALGGGMGLAIPHTKHPGVHRLMGVFGRSREGVDFASPDGKPVHMFFLLLSNREYADRHLEALAYICNCFRDAEFRNCLMKAPNAVQIKEFFDDADMES